MGTQGLRDTPSFSLARALELSFSFAILLLLVNVPVYGMDLGTEVVQVGFWHGRELCVAMLLDHERVRSSKDTRRRHVDPRPQCDRAAAGGVTLIPIPHRPSLSVKPRHGSRTFSCGRCPCDAFPDSLDTAASESAPWDNARHSPTSIHPSSSVTSTPSSVVSTFFATRRSWCKAWSSLGRYLSTSCFPHTFCYFFVTDQNSCFSLTLGGFRVSSTPSHDNQNHIKFSRLLIKVAQVEH